MQSGFRMALADSQTALSGAHGGFHLIEFKPHRKCKEEHDHNPDQGRMRPLFWTSGPKTIVNIPLPRSFFELS